MYESPALRTRFCFYDWGVEKAMEISHIRKVK